MENLSWIEIIYWGATIVGGTLFLLRTILLLVGGIGHHDFDTHFDGDVHVDHDFHFDADHDIHFDADHEGTFADSDFSFKLLSMQGVTAFFMLFGLVGLALLRANLPTSVTVLGGILAGLFAVWVISVVFSQMKRLQADGTLDIQNAIGQNGTVYLTIPIKGTGRVQVIVQGALRIFDAKSRDEEILKTGDKIRVTGIIDSSTLEVEKI